MGAAVGVIKAEPLGIAADGPIAFTSLTRLTGRVRPLPCAILVNIRDIRGLLASKRCVRKEHVRKIVRTGNTRNE